MYDDRNCSKCHSDKELPDFNFRKDTQKCRDCFKLINKEYRTMIKDEIKIRRKELCENIKYKNLKRIYDIDYHERNREKIQLYKKNYFQNNEEEMYKKNKKRKDENIIFRLACNLRKREINAFKAPNVRKTNKTFDLLGCFHSFYQRCMVKVSCMVK